MPNVREIEFHEAMLNIYRRAKAEAKYNATLFLQMVVDHGGLQAARTLINSNIVSTGYTALWDRGRLDLTVEAMCCDLTDTIRCLRTKSSRFARRGFASTDTSVRDEKR